MFLTEDDKNFIKKNFTDADTLLATSDVNLILDAISDCIDDKGFAPPDYYEYNAFGREAQRVHDRIFKNN